MIGQRLRPCYGVGRTICDSTSSCRSCHTPSSCSRAISPSTARLLAPSPSVGTCGRRNGGVLYTRYVSERHALYCVIQGGGPLTRRYRRMGAGGPERGIV